MAKDVIEEAVISYHKFFYQSVQKLIAVGCWNKSALGGKFLKN